MPEQPPLTEEQAKALQEKIKNMSPEELREFQKQQCIFCQIVAGKVPAKKIYSDEFCIAVMDINPATRGHLLLIPKEHYAIMPQVPDAETGHFMLVAKYLSQLQLRLLRATGTTVFIANGQAAGQRSQHFMIHLLPRKEHDELLPGEERVVDAPVRAKVREAVQKRFNEIMGIQEKPGAAEKKKVEKRKEEEVPEEEQEQKEPLREELSREETESVPEEEVPEDKKQKKAAKRKTTAAKSGTAPAGQASDDISLDDIANLFR